MTSRRGSAESAPTTSNKASARRIFPSAAYLVFDEISHLVLEQVHRNMIFAGAQRQRKESPLASIITTNLINSLAAAASLPIPSNVKWAYFMFGLVLAVGLAVIFLRGHWQKAPGLEKLVLFGPLFYGAPLAAFGTEHFTSAKDIASLVPAWIPWHLFWAYFVGACFIAAPLSLVTRIQARLAASLLALTFFLFVVLMDAPAWAHHLGNRFAAALTLRELAFSGGALGLAASLTEASDQRSAQIQATIARFFVAIPVLFYSFEQFLHADHVPGVPLERMVPNYVFGGPAWTYLAAALYAVAGIPLFLGKKTRIAATWVGLTVLFVELVVYVPIAVVDRATIDGFNYMADTLMFCGAVLLLASAMPRET
jgi:uncharacterized membrane protein YphA (DoxX/SURF4 family)